MSTYVRNKVIRIRVPKEIEQDICTKFNIDNLYDLEDILKNKVQRAPTEQVFIDYEIETEWACDGGDWVKTRALYESEFEKYKDLFTSIHKDLTINKARLVEYCWYNCCEAPDYFDEKMKDDSFYKEV